jgi:glutamate-ammonia-ligase adenylyltransferase
VAQRLIVALTTPTTAGTLYEVDMRLRPTGNKGPAAVSLETFRRYHATEAWTWEHMALTRARVIAGPEQLGARVADEIRRRLTQPNDPATIIRDARDMRARIAQSFSDTNPWDLKYARGGLVDIEFIAQTLQLVHAPRLPQVLDTNTIAALGKLGQAGLLSARDVETLIASADLHHALTQVLRIALDETLKVESASPGLKELLARAGGMPDFASLVKQLATLQAQTRTVFDAVMAGQDSGSPSGASASHDK